MPAFSVIIPAYNHASFLREAVESVLNQTCQDFEVIVVDDASTDETGEVMKQFQDRRIYYLVHDKNRGISASRNTGIRAATGDYLAFLDADDLFAPQKLEFHLSYLRQHPDISVTYNARFDLNHSSKTIRGIWRPPLKVGLSDFVLGFPFAPSDMVMRKDWLFRVGLLNENRVFYGEDLDFFCQLALSGCDFASVNRALNYRRYHSSRRMKDIAMFEKVCLEILDIVFTDPRCPATVAALKDSAFAIKHLLLGLIALAQNDTVLGQASLRKAVRLNPAILTTERGQVLDLVIHNSVADDSVDHALLLRRVLDQLPPELSWLTDQYPWAVAQGYLIKGVRAFVWGRREDGQRFIDEAVIRGAKLNRPFLETLTAHLLDYEMEFGAQPTDGVIKILSPSIRQLGGRSSLKWLIGNFSINRAFHSYHSGAYRDVPKSVFCAVFNNPNYLQNRGAIKILLSSVVRAAQQIPFSPFASLAADTSARG